MGYLTLRFDDEGDSTGELFLEFSANGFAGKGSAWIRVSTLEDWAKKLSQYPLPSAEPVKIEGGYGGDGAPIDERLHISAYPVGPLGDIGVHVRVATDTDYYDRLASRHFAGVELKTNYEELGRFSTHILALMRGDRREVTLKEVDRRRPG